MMGDRAVLERYREARGRYEESEREVARQGQDLQRAQIELNRVRREVTRLEEWERAAEKVFDLERRRNEAAQKLPELRTKLKNGESERIRLERDREEAEAAARTAEAKLAAARREEGEATVAFEQAARSEGALAAEVSALEEAAAAVARLPARDLAAVELDEAAAARTRVLAEATAERADTEEREARERLAVLEAGRPAHPAPVERMLAALAGRGIAATLLAAVVEAEAGASAAAEAALGDARYALAVAPEHEPLALALAAEHAFPGPIWSGPTVSGPEDAGPLRLEAGAPACLRAWSAAVRLGPDGSWTDERGRWAARDVEPALGERAREAGLAAARQRAKSVAATVAADRAALDVATRAHGEVAKALGEERRRCELAARVARLPERKAALAAADEQLALARALHEEKKHDVVAASTLLQRARADARQSEKGLEELERRLEGERKALREAEEETLQADEEIRALSRDVAPELRARAERMELDSVETTRAPQHAALRRPLARDRAGSRVHRAAAARARRGREPHRLRRLLPGRGGRALGRDVRVDRRLSRTRCPRGDRRRHARWCDGDRMVRPRPRRCAHRASRGELVSDLPILPDGARRSPRGAAHAGPHRPSASRDRARACRRPRRRAHRDAPSPSRRRRLGRAGGVPRRSPERVARVGPSSPHTWGRQPSPGRTPNPAANPRRNPVRSISGVGGRGRSTAMRAALRTRSLVEEISPRARVWNERTWAGSMMPRTASHASLTFGIESVNTENVS